MLSLESLRLDLNDNAQLAHLGLVCQKCFINY